MVTKEEDDVNKAPEDNLQRRQSADPALHTSHAAQEVSAAIILEKPLEDGYNWRKYGQKNVKGKEYVRSYYKCSYPNCQVKKQVERSHDGKITDITYLGKHDHAKPHSESQEAVPSIMSSQVHTPDCPKPAGGEDKSSNVHPLTDDAKPKEKCELPAVALPDPTTPVSCQLSNQAKDDQNENLISKRRKKGADGADFSVEKPGHESRHVIRSVSEVDIVNDGYRWRKYGQKMVKGNPNPRSYYRCSTAGCPVKKHVERASHDPKVVITTYEGEHDHTMPSVRTVVPQITAPAGGGTESNGDGKPKLEESDAALNGTTCKSEKNHVADPMAEEETNAAKMVETKPKITSCEQDTQGKDQKIDHVDQTSKEPNEKKMEDPICRGTSNDNIDQSSKQEETTPVNDVKLEDLSMEPHKTDPLIDSSYHEAKSNGQPRVDTEAVNS